MAIKQIYGPNQTAGIPVVGTGKSVPQNDGTTPLAQLVGLVDSTGALIEGGNPLPVSASFSPSGTQDVNLLQVAGAAVKTGNGTASGAVRVTLASDGTGIVTTPYSLSQEISGSFTPVGTYAAGQLIGASGAGNAIFLPASGLPAGTKIKIERAWVAFTYASATTATSGQFQFLKSAPSGTYTDAANPPSTDAANFAAPLSGAQGLSLAASATVAVVSGTAAGTPLYTAVDANGKIPFFIVSGGAVTMTTPGTATYHIQFSPL